LAGAIPLYYNARSLLARRVSSIMTALAVALVVMILFILSGFVAGLKHTVMQSATRGNYIVVSRGADSETASYISHEQYEIVKSRSQIAAAPNGDALISPEMMTGFNPAPDAPPSQQAFTYLRGVRPIAYQVHRSMKLLSGRWPLAGGSEMVVGRNIEARFPRELAVGSDFRFGRRTWHIVGVFSDNGSARESEVWTDLDALTQDIRYANGFAVLHVILRPGTEDAFQKSLDADQRLKLDSVEAQTFYARELGFVDQLRALGLVVAIILAVGSTFGAMNTMYAAVARRSKEIGVLRALGFTSSKVLASFMAESVMLALAGGVAGEALGLVVASATGLNSRLLNVGEYIFAFRITPSAFVTGLVAAAIIGGLGGLLPAWQAARVRVVDSLRAA
jgi:ABC-type lipoprotein release transport system permease subunit